MAGNSENCAKVRSQIEGKFDCLSVQAEIRAGVERSEGHFER